MTDENEKLVSKYIEDNNVTYPIVIEQGNKSMRALGLSGFPSTCLVDIDGNVIWTGRGEPPSDVLDKALAGARVPGFKLTSALKSLEKALEKSEFAKVHTATKALLAGNLDDESKKVADELVAMIEGDAKRLVDKAQAFVDSQDWPDAVKRYETVVDNYLGVPGTEGVDAKLKALKADPDVKKAMKGGELLGKADAFAGDGEFDKAYAGYKSIAKSYANLKCGEEAAKKMADIVDKGLLGFEKNCPRCKEQGAACDKHKKKAR